MDYAKEYSRYTLVAALFFSAFAQAAVGAEEVPLELSGMSVTPHLMLETMRYLNPPEPADGARVQLFLKCREGANGTPVLLNGETGVTFDGQSPADLLASGAWAWHDTPSATPDDSMTLRPGEMTVWTFNGRKKPFGVGGRVAMAARQGTTELLSTELNVDAPACWLSAVTFFSTGDALLPDRMMVHLANASDGDLTMRSCRLWLARDGGEPRVFTPRPLFMTLECFNGHALIPAGDRGGFTLDTAPIPRSYAVVEVVLEKSGGEEVHVWGHVRVKPECFDISGGWVNDDGSPVTKEVFLKALKRIHVNTAHLGVTPGYSDTPLYDQYPIKYFGSLTPFEQYDNDEMLPRIHAAEFLGEPQYGGGRPVPPQEVWEKLLPYTATRLPTTLTHSEEKVWRDYAGLSDYPHYDAYRVTAPSADAWQMYDRWNGKRIGWGAPLETIGDMCRSLRELNRPAPCAIWSQGPHAGWEFYGGRLRTSPTPDEIRLQAYHALSTRITSLYWFNLSRETLVKWRDTLDELGRIGREMRMMDEYLLEGDAFAFERRYRDGNKPDWDLASVCGPRAALLFALDLDYTPEPKKRVFVFGEPRAAEWSFPLPAYLRDVSDVFRFDADGIHDVDWSKTDSGVKISEKMSRVGVYLATADAGARAHLESKRTALIALEDALDFDPARNDADFEQLVALEPGKK